MARRSRLVTREGRAMGSPLRLVTTGDIADEVWPLVLDGVAVVERTLTRFDPHSPLSWINRRAGSGAWMTVPTVLRRALVIAHRGYRLSGGFFDPRIIGALEALGERAGVPLPASPGMLRPAERWLEIDRRTGRARLSAPVDMGGMGKGMALGAVSRVFDEIGVDTYLVESGGDLVVKGRPPGDRHWGIAIEHPDRALPSAIIGLAHGALATSSLRVRQWRGSDGSVLHHLIDPSTGRPATGLRSMTVAAATPVWAEIWSTAGFVSAARTVRWRSNSAAWWVTDAGELRMNVPGLQVVKCRFA